MRLSDHVLVRAAQLAKPMLLKRGMRCTFGGCRKKARKLVITTIFESYKLEARPACEKCAAVFGPFYNARVIDFEAWLQQAEAR